MLLQLQRLLIANKSKIIWCFFVVECLTPLFWIAGVYTYLNDIGNYAFFYDIGANLGTVAFGLYCVTLIPGILKRFRFFPILQAMIMPFRRHIGVLMFLTAILHMSFTTTILLFFTPPIDFSVIMTHQVLGFVAVCALFPLWVTSNDYSVRTLKRNWTLLHKLTYVACLFIFLHLTFVEKKLAVIGFMFLSLEILSWLYFWYNQRKARLQMVAPAPQPSQIHQQPVTTSSSQTPQSGS